MYKAARGTTDILPQEQAYWRFIEQKASSLCQLYGYKRIDTPVFEPTELFSRSVGEGTDIVEKEMYSFADRSGTELTLRPEGTAPICRAYIEHGMQNLPQPVRLYYFASIFRYERPQRGRYRQHHQFGFEALGEADAALDAEVIEMAWGFYAWLELGRLALLLNSIGCRRCCPGYLQSLKQYYSGYGKDICPNCKIRLKENPLRLLDCKKPFCREVARTAPKVADYLCPECDRHFSETKKHLRALGIPFEVEHRLVRGLDYYTRTVFEIQPEGEEGAQSTLGGGGRYDYLVEELGGKPTPAIGFATGIERIVLNLKTQHISLPSAQEAEVYVAHLGEEAKEEALKLLVALRQAGIPAVGALGGRSLKAQLKQADAWRVVKVVIIGEEELKKGTVVVRNMAKGEQKEVPFVKLIELVKDPLI